MKEINQVIKRFHNILYYKKLHTSNELLKTVYTQLFNTFSNDFKIVEENDIIISKQEYLELLLLKTEIKRKQFKEMLDLNLEYSKEYYVLYDEIKDLQTTIDYLKLT